MVLTLLHTILHIYSKRSIACRIWSCLECSVALTNDDNEALTAPFRFDEFKEAMFSIQVDVCPNPGFYQQLWDMCGQEIFVIGCIWLESGTFLLNLNATNIVLIHRGEIQITMKD